VLFELLKSCRGEDWENWLKEANIHGSNLSSLMHTASIPVSKW
jgi:hypothetical protein